MEKWLLRALLLIGMGALAYFGGTLASIVMELMKFLSPNDSIYIKHLGICIAVLSAIISTLSMLICFAVMQSVRRIKRDVQNIASGRVCREASFE